MQVTAILSCTLEMGSDVLVAHLLNDCHLLDWLVGVQTEVTATPCPGDERQASLMPLQTPIFPLLTQLRDLLTCNSVLKTDYCDKFGLRGAASEVKILMQSCKP